MSIITLKIDDHERISEKIHDPAWSFLIQLRDDRKCQACGRGKDEAVLHAHHLNGDPRDNRLENGQCLCTHCHMSITHLGRKHAPEHIEARIAPLRGKKRSISDAGRLGLRAAGKAHRGRVQSTEHLANRMRSRWGPDWKPKES